MYNNPFYIPMYPPTMISPNLIRGIPTTRAIPTASALARTAGSRAATSGGLLSRLIPGLSGIKSINWGGIINNTSKTLGIINQTIPIARQVGPMVTNVKQMMRVASLFKDETDTNTTSRIRNNPTKSTNNTNPTINNQTIISSEQTPNNYPNFQDNINYNDASPTFFINT